MQGEATDSSVDPNEDPASSHVVSSVPPVVEHPEQLAAPAPVENREQPERPDHSKIGNRPDTPLVLPRPTRSAEGRRFKALQLFEGTVAEADEDAFVATLRDQTDPAQPLQRATISIDNVWESDRDLIAPGAVFYWSIGYQIQPHGQRSLTSTMRFRRLPAWTASDLRRAEDIASSFDDFFSDE